MRNDSPSTETWRKLYQAAVDFADLQPWKWMWDSELFGVENSETGQVGYCCVMGRLGEHFALGMYRGPRGLAGFRAAASGKFEGNKDEFLIAQDCLQASFEDKSDLEPEDLVVIKNLGLKFHGANTWPKFRSYEPGQYPWFLNAAEAEWLACALTEAAGAAKRVRDDSGPIHSRGGKLLVRKTFKTSNGNIAWRDEWLAPETKIDEIVPPSPDANRLEQIKARSLPRSGNWEVDFEYLLTPIHDKPRPYFPVMFVVVHQETGSIVNGEMLQNMEPAGLRSAFLKAIQQSGMLPEYVLVKREELAKILMSAAKSLDFGLSVVQKLPEIAKVRAAMKDFLRRRHKF